MNPTPTNDLLARLWRSLGLWTRRRWAVSLGGMACAALSGTLVFAAPPRSYPPAFSPTTPQSSAPTAGPQLTPPPPSAPRPATNRNDGPDLFPPSASPIPTTVREGPQLFPASATTPGVTPVSEPLLTRDEAVRWALQANPEIAAIRMQHGIAAASIVIARTYPFNPVLETRVRAAEGPISAGITNRVDVESVLLMEIEIRGQGRLRKVGAAAGLSRTDNEIAFQELTLAIRAGRAYDTLIYRLQKAALADEAVRLTRDDVERVRKLVQLNKAIKPSDQITINSELNDFIAQAGMARASVAPALTDLRRAIGVLDEFDVNDSLETPPLHLDANTLIPLALDRRPDRLSHENAVAEAEARLKLEIANRYGNPVAGPAFGYDPTRIDLIGASVSMPIPVFNRHTGDIRQREAERDRAVLELRQVEVQIAHDVEGALTRMAAAREWAESYRTKVIPELKTAVKQIEELYNLGDPATTNVDILRVIDVHRKLLRARDGYLDAQWELRQAQADLAAALGDPALLAPSLCGGLGAPPVSLP